MDNKKAMICATMLARSNVGFGLPAAVDVRSCINFGRSKFEPTMIGLSEAMIGDRNGDGAIEYVADEAEGWFERFSLDSYTDEQFEKDYPDAAKMYDLAAIPNHQIAERFEHAFYSANTTDFCHTPLSKEEMDLWLKNMPAESPTGIAVMVGFNYAMNQMRNILRGEANG